MTPPQKNSRAFTIIELLVVIAIVSVLIGIRLPALAANKAGVQRIYCSNNLKQVGVAFRTWAGKNAGRMPMATPGSQGGAAEAIGRRGNGASFANNILTVNGATGSYVSGGGVFAMFAVMSNELTTPKILYCPSEYRSTTFQGSLFGNSTGTNAGCYSDNQISYFVGVDANENSSDMFLSGDSNIGDGATPPTLSNIYSDVTSIRKYVALGTNVAWAATSPNWGDNQHGKRGSVAFVDGSVQYLDSTQLRLSLNRTGDFDRNLTSPFVRANGTSPISKNRLQFP